MSVTMKAVLALPSLKGAQVVAGESALSKTVASVTVLEYADPTPTQKALYQRVNFDHDEIVLTAFASIRNNVEAQCQNIEDLADAGEIGMILFYVGIVLPSLNKRVIETAQRRNFLLVCMPTNAPDLTYSVVIGEILFAVFNDQVTNPNFATELVEQVSGMPSYRRNLDTVLRLLSDRLKASVALVNATNEIIVEQNWPRTNQVDWHNQFHGEQGAHAHATRHYLAAQKLYLLIYKETGLSKTIQNQAIETTRIALNLWNDTATANNNLVMLVAAIIQNEPQRIAALAQKCKLKISDLNDLLVISCGSITSRREKIKRDLERIANNYLESFICVWYQDDLLLFPLDTKISLQEWNDWQQAIVLYGQSHDQQLTTTRFMDLQGAQKIRQAYLDHHAYLPLVEIVFPHTQKFTGQNIEFVHHCQVLMTNKHNPVSKWLMLIEALAPDLQKTLVTFLLDAGGNPEDTANLLFIHRNTAKYRLTKINNYFGFRVGEMPESFGLYQATGIFRITNGDSD